MARRRLVLQAIEQSMVESDPVECVDVGQQVAQHQSDPVAVTSSTCMRRPSTSKK